MTSTGSVISLIVILSVLMVSCTAQRSPRIRRPRVERNYEVSVYTDGKRVDDISQQLIHRIALSPASIEQITRPWPAGLELPFLARTERDLLGKPIGFRVRGRSDLLGLLNDDLVTAVNLKRVEDVRDLWRLFDGLQKTGSGSLTLHRGGIPHKVLYTIRKPK